MPENWYLYLLLLPAGLIAGVVNTIAGGGSFLTLPALMACGLPPQVANGSNRIAILLQSALGTHIYRKKGMLDGKSAGRLILPMLIGAGAGSWLAAVMDPALFKQVFGGLFLLMAVVMIAKPKALLAGHERVARPRWVEFIAFVGLGVYGGFIQAGVGVLFLIVSVLASGMDLSRANGVKLAVVCLVQVIALGVFIYFDQVDWLAGGVLAIGNTLGAPIGAKLALEKGAKLIFGFVLVVMLATGVKLLVG